MSALSTLPGSAGTQAAGLGVFRDAAGIPRLVSARQGHGPFAAYLTADLPARYILEGERDGWMSSDADPERLVDRPGSRRALVGTSSVPRLCHNDPAADGCWR